MAEEKKLQIPVITPVQLEKMLEVLDAMDNPPALMVYGAPGIGKTSILNAFADKKGYDLRVKHLSRMDSTDWSGVPKQSKDQKFTEFMPISIFRPLEKNKKKIVLFFDELNTAMPQVLNAALDVILEKKGDGEDAVLKEDTIILAAGNLGEEDGTYVDVLSSAVKTRMIQVRMNQDVDEWIQWAEKNTLDGTVIEFITKKGENFLIDLDGFKNNLDQVATPRGWERVSQYVKTIYAGGAGYTEKERRVIFTDMVLGTVGDRRGRAFLEFFFKKYDYVDNNEVQDKWEKQLALAKVIYLGNIPDFTPAAFAEIVSVVNYGLEYGLKGSAEAAEELAIYIKTNLSRLQVGMLTGIAGMNTDSFEKYLLENKYTSALTRLKSGR